MTKILGISAFYHDSAAALIEDGELIFAAQEERFTRIKHDKSFPLNSIKFILTETQNNLNDVDAVIFYEDPKIKFSRILDTFLRNAPKNFSQFYKAFDAWLGKKFFFKNFLFRELQKIDRNFKEEKIIFTKHHLSHAASAYYLSPFHESLILTVDGVGEFNSTLVSLGKKNKISELEFMNFPHSLGLFYSAFTDYCGFKVNSGEYKLMGLAPYGKPIYKDLIYKKLIKVHDDGSFNLNLIFFDFETGNQMINKRFEKLFGKNKRNQDDKINEFYMNVAASIQVVCEEILLKMLKYLRNKYDYKNLCLAGGVALNCVANAKILKSKIFENIWIQPAAGDAGGAIGSAFYHWHNNLDNIKKDTNKEDKMKGTYLGPKFESLQIKKIFDENDAVYQKLEFDELIKVVAKSLSNGKAVGWFQDRMEFGPRALGNRSILADPRSKSMQKNLNLKIKFRESFRPFAPSVMNEHAAQFFDLPVESPFMMYVSKIKKHYKDEEDINLSSGFDKLNKVQASADLPAITHVDFTARLQTVSKKTNYKFHSLLNEFMKITDCPILVNTSFNIRGEPIVCNPLDALKCFYGTNLDILVCENYILFKEHQNKNDLSKNYKKLFLND